MNLAFESVNLRGDSFELLFKFLRIHSQVIFEDLPVAFFALSEVSRSEHSGACG